MRVTAQMNPEVLHVVACELIDHSKGNSQMPSIAAIKASYSAMLRDTRFSKKEKQGSKARGPKKDLNQLVIEDWAKVKSWANKAVELKDSNPDLFNALVSEYQYFFPQELGMNRKTFGLPYSFYLLWVYMNDKRKVLKEAIKWGLPSRTQREIMQELETSPDHLRVEYFSKIPPQIEEIETDEELHERKRKGAQPANKYLKIVGGRS